MHPYSVSWTRKQALSYLLVSFFNKRSAKNLHMKPMNLHLDLHLEEVFFFRKIRKGAIFLLKDRSFQSDIKISDH